MIQFNIWFWWKNQPNNQLNMYEKWETCMNNISIDLFLCMILMEKKPNNQPNMHEKWKICMKNIHGFMFMYDFDGKKNPSTNQSCMTNTHSFNLMYAFDQKKNTHKATKHVWKIWNMHANYPSIHFDVWFWWKQIPDNQQNLYEKRDTLKNELNNQQIIDIHVTLCWKIIKHQWNKHWRMRQMKGLND